SITLWRLSLSITVCSGAALVLRKERARSPSEGSPPSDCAIPLTGNETPTSRAINASQNLPVMDFVGQFTRLLCRNANRWSLLACGRHSRSEEHTSELQSPYDLVC